ncbi:MAG: D-lyxose/D-mannose family sugar isomerase [Cyanobacteria bacterium PR.3.49]|jgi:D-lyxose ketol-isomerase|nr:D-lyxose/D-mannose family sugar isomerase [Cyanobacteria bacterium PR.3.49]
MKQSEINLLLNEAAECLKKHNWKLPPEPEWCATDFGLGDYEKAGLVEVLLCNEPEYCEKIMYARENMVTPCHTHYEKKEDIIVRHGRVKFTLWNKNPEENKAEGTVEIKINRKMETKKSGEPFELKEGERVTLTAGVWHEFAPVGGPALIGEVSTYCNEEIDNVFADKKVDIFQAPEADEKVATPCC